MLDIQFQEKLVDAHVLEWLAFLFLSDWETGLQNKVTKSMQITLNPNNVQTKSLHQNIYTEDLVSLTQRIATSGV